MRMVFLLRCLSRSRSLLSHSERYYFKALCYYGGITHFSRRFVSIRILFSRFFTPSDKNSFSKDCKVFLSFPLIISSTRLSALSFNYRWLFLTLGLLKTSVWCGGTVYPAYSVSPLIRKPYISTQCPGHVLEGKTPANFDEKVTFFPFHRAFIPALFVVF